ncbi:MAG: RNA polymerase sigma factor [Ruminococcaceae bacterium]|nr:RNA polymerase sigma factor [Oscillospiraceae bacterium]
MDLNECFSRLRDGDKEAFTIIYEELKRPVFTVACRIVQSKETAEDITHDVFVKIYLSPPDRSVRNPRAWVFQMARNLAIDALRKKKTDDIDLVDIAQEDLIDKAVLSWDVESAISHLPQIEREIISLHITGGLSFSCISRITGLSLPSVYRRYRKALGTLKCLLDGGIL